MNKKAAKISILILVPLLIIAILTTVITGIFGRRPSAKAASVYDGTALLDVYYKNTSTAVNKLTKMFGISSLDAESVMNDREEWKAYSLEIEVDNKSKEDITLYTYDVPNNGKDNIWLITVADPEIEIISGNKLKISVMALAKGKDITAADAADAIKKYIIKIDYSKTPNKNDAGVESIERHKTIKVK